MNIALLCSLDSKGPESEYLKQQIESRGADTTLIDIGIGGEPQIDPDISADEIDNIIGETIVLDAATGIGGAGDADIDIDSGDDTLAARTVTSGGIYIEDSDFRGKLLNVLKENIGQSIKEIASLNLDF